MANVVLSVATQPFAAPLGSVGGLFKFRLVGESAGLTLEAAGVMVTFENVPRGDYDTRAWREDANTGQIIGAVATGRRILASEFETMVDVPVTIVVTVG